MWIVIPVYNEEEALKIFFPQIKAKAKELNAKLLFIDDGSTDKTKEIVKNHVISLKENKGQQFALWFGIMYAYKHGAKAILTMDGDGQQGVEDIDKFINCYKKGADVVYGIRDNSNYSKIKALTAYLYYKTLRILSPTSIPFHNDFRLMSRRAVKEASRYNIHYLRGMFAKTRYKTDKVFFTYKKRLGGKTKYGIKEQLKLGIKGILFERANCSLFLSIKKRG